MTIPGRPKLGSPSEPGPGIYPGVVSVGGDLHGGHGYKGAVVDDYPVRYGLTRNKRPESSSVPPDHSAAPRRRRYYQGRG